MKEERENVQNVFKNLQIYIDNFKPITQIETKYRDKMVAFLHEAYECHLKPKNEKEEELEQRSAKRQKNKKSCELCLAKEQLKRYESVIVDTITNMKIGMRDNDEQARGDVCSWKAPYQETILKSKSPNELGCCELNWKYSAHYKKVEYQSVYSHRIMIPFCYFAYKPTF